MPHSCAGIRRVTCCNKVWGLRVRRVVAITVMGAGPGFVAE